MSGHSKWSTIRRQKAVVDAKRGVVFTKLANIITIAARAGGDPEMNPTLRTAIDQAREANLPKANIDRAIKRGTGELSGQEVEELYYEGIGPAGIQFMIKCLTDNRNRSAATIRHLFTKHGGALTSVKWNFNLAGVIVIALSVIKDKKINLENLELNLIDQGIIDFKKEEDFLIFQTTVLNFSTVLSFLEKLDLKTESAVIEYAAKDKLRVKEDDQIKLNKFMEELDDNEDVSDYYHNIA